jgi:hypothetical protein
MPRPSPRTVALRNQILKVLRTAEHPLPTPEIFVRIADEGRNCNGLKGPTCPDWNGRFGGVYNHCPAWCWETPGPLGPQIRPQMVALERLKLVERVDYPNAESITKAVADGNVYEHVMNARSGCVYWQSVNAETDEYFNTVVNTAETEIEKVTDA